MQNSTGLATQDEKATVELLPAQKITEEIKKLCVGDDDIHREILDSARQVTEWCLRNPLAIFVNKWLSFLIVRFPRFGEFKIVKKFVITPDILIIKILLERNVEKD